MSIYLVRHAESEWNAQSRVCGRSDIALSEAGRRQAASVAARLSTLRVEALYASPLRRAVETAELIGKRVDATPIIEPRLIELNYGTWEGKNFGEIIQEDGSNFSAWDADPAAVAPPGGETGMQAIARAAPLLASWREVYAQTNIIVVSHKSLSRLIICHALGIPPSEYRRRLSLENASISIIQPESGGWRLFLFNDTSHLAPSGEHRASANAVF